MVRSKNPFGGMGERFEYLSKLALGKCALDSIPFQSCAGGYRPISDLLALAASNANSLHLGKLRRVWVFGCCRLDRWNWLGWLHGTGQNVRQLRGWFDFGFRSLQLWAHAFHILSIRGAQEVEWHRLDRVVFSAKHHVFAIDFLK